MELSNARHSLTRTCVAVILKPYFFGGGFHFTFSFLFLVLLLLIYGCFRCIQVGLWCKFRTEIPKGKYFLRLGPSGPPCAQNGSEK